MNLYLDKLRMCAEWQKKIQNDGFTHFVTFNYNPNAKLNIETAKKSIYGFRARIDRKLYGKKYTKEPRTSIISFIEHSETNLHYHAVIRTQDIQGFNANAEQIWQKLVKSGSLHIEEKNFSEEDIKRISVYITKDYLKSANSEHFLML